MSRAYRIAVKESVRRHVRIEDGVCTSLELLEILPQEAMSELLAKELEGRGFKREGDKEVRDEADGVRVEVGLKDGRVAVRLAKETELEAPVERAQLLGREDDGSAKAALRDAARAGAEGQIDAKKERLRQGITEKLERRLGDLQQEVDAISHRVTAEALKVRASQLGEIEEISEDAETGSMTIKVRT